MVAPELFEAEDMAREQITADTEVTTTEVAAMFGKTARRIQQLTQDGVLVPSRRGRFRIADVIQQWVDHAVGDGESEEELERARVKRAVHDARLKEAKASIESMRAEELKGTMHRADDVKVLTEDMIYTVRSALMALPGRVAVDAHSAGTAAEAAAVITREVHKIMRELAAYEYDPERYAERVRERERWMAQDSDEDEDGGEE